MLNKFRLTLLLVIFLLLNSCSSEVTEIYFDLFKSFRAAQVEFNRPDKYLLRLETLNLKKDIRNFIHQPPSTKVLYYLYLPQKSFLSFATGMDIVSWKITTGVELSIWLTPEGGTRHRIFVQNINPKDNKLQSGWMEQKVDLSVYGGKLVRLEFVSSCSKTPYEKTSVGWGNPRIMYKRIKNELRNKMIIKKVRNIVKPANKNIFWYVMERQLTLHTGAYGNPSFKTPYFDRLSRKSFLFKGMISPSLHPVRIVSSFVTGQYSSQHGLTLKRKKYKKSISTIASILKFAGYKSAAFTNRKLTIIPFRTTYDFDKNYYLYENSIRGAGNNQAMNVLFSKALNGWLTETTEYSRFAFIFRSISQRSLMNLDTNFNVGNRIKISKDTSFLEKQKFLYNRLSYVNDQNLGFILKFLAKRGQLKNSVLIVSGSYFDKIHLTLEKNIKEFNLQFVNVKNPLLFFLPRKSNSSFLVNTFVSGCDIVPTILDYLQLKQPINLNGKSFLPLINGNSVDYKAKSIFVDYLPQKATMIKDDIKIDYLRNKENYTLSFYNILNNPEKELSYKNNFKLLYLKQQFFLSPLFDNLNRLKNNKEFVLESKWFDLAPNK